MTKFYASMGGLYWVDEDGPHYYNPEAWAVIKAHLDKQRAKPRITGKLARFPKTIKPPTAKR